MRANDPSSEGCASAASARPQFESRVLPRNGTRGSACLREVSDGRRHAIHLSPLEAHNRPILLYVTACTKDRHHILASPSAHEAIVAAWTAGSTWLVGRYVVLPDHVHLFCA